MSVVVAVLRLPPLLCQLPLCMLPLYPGMIAFLAGRGEQSGLRKNALLGVLDFRRRPWVLQVGDPVCPRFVYVLVCQQCHAVPIEAVLLSVRVTKVDTPGGPKRYRIDAEDREKADAAFKELRPSLAPAKKAAPVGGAGAASAAALAGTKGVAAVQELEPARTPAPRRPGARQATQYARS